MGGTAPYSYLWSNGSNSEDLVGLPAGNYTCTITDANACQQISLVVIGVGCPSPGTPCDDGDPYTFDDIEDGNCNCAGTPCPIINPNVIATDITCFGASDGAMAVSPDGGTAPYAISWSTGSTDFQINNLAPETYYVSITDANGCLALDSLNITQPPALATAILGTDESSPGASDGKADLFVMGGTAPYSYLWSNGSTSEDLGALPAGNYTCTITDANACQQISLVVIGVGCPSPGTLCNDQDPNTFDDREDGNCNCAGTPCPFINPNVIATDITCFGASDGELITTPTGGLSPYSFNWSTGNKDFYINDLSAGTYFLTITDANGCEAFESSTLIDALIFEYEILVHDESRGGASDGTAHLKINESKAYSFVWSTGETTQKIENLPGNQYYGISITDEKGCTVEDSAYVAEFLCAGLHSGEFSVEASREGSCDGNGVLRIRGPMVTAQLQFSIGGDSVQMSPVFENLHIGSYQPIVLDVKSGCSIMLPKIDIGLIEETQVTEIHPMICDSTSGAIEIESDRKRSLALSPEGPWFKDRLSDLSAGIYPLYSREIDSDCITFEGNFELKAAAQPMDLLFVEIDHAACGSERGTLGFTPANEISYSLDAGNSWYTSRKEFSVTPGNYQILLKSKDSCIIDFGSATIIQEEQLIPYVQIEHPTSCFSEDGQISIETISQEVSFSIDHGATWRKDGDFKHLRSGKYQVLFASNSGTCLDSIDTDLLGLDTSLNIEVKEHLDPSCHGAQDGFLALSSSGGLAPYKWKWSDGNEGPQVGRLAAGTYEVLLTDQRHCGQTIELELHDPPAINLGLPKIDSILYCQGQTIPITLSESSLDYTWFHNSNLISHENSIAIAKEGKYTVIGRDSSGCEVQDSLEISYNDEVFVANFLISSTVLVGQEIKAIENSWPVPEHVTWTVEGGSILDTFLNQATLFFPLVGEYFVRMIARRDGCSALVEKLITVVDSTDQNQIPVISSEGFKIQIFPNPNLGVFNLIVELLSEKDLQIRIYDPQARLIFSDQKYQVLTMSQEIDIAGAPPGIYTLLVQSESQWRTINFLLE